jgi:hypothetical protein
MIFHVKPKPQQHERFWLAKGFPRKPAGAGQLTPTDTVLNQTKSMGCKIHHSVV